MLAQRTTQQSLRRLAGTTTSTLSRTTAQRWASPAAIATSMAIQSRPATSTPQTTQLKPSDSYEILVAQRKLRPVSPHLTIYRPQIPWIMSGTNRATAVLCAGGLYVFSLSYLVAPLFGWHLESATLAAGFAAWPIVAKVATKFVVAMPFTYHVVNSFRHFAWDLGKEFANKSVIRSGWAAVVVSVGSAVVLATMY